MFVDDEPGIRATLPAVLEQKGLSVRVAADVGEALAAIQNQHFDVLVSDLNINEPGDGFKVIAAMRRANPECVAILLTGYPDFETAVEGIRHQIDDYIVKPADLDYLLIVIEKRLCSLSHPPKDA